MLPLLVNEMPNHPAAQSNYLYVGMDLSSQKPMFAHIDLLAYPSLVLGTTGRGKTELLLSLCTQAALKGWPVFYLDGKAERSTWNRLHFYTKFCQAPRPTKFYGLMPSVAFDQLSHTWNPFLAQSVPIDTRIETIFKTYQSPHEKNAGVSYYRETEKSIFTALARSLEASGYAYNINDIITLLSDERMIDSLGPLLRPEGREAYATLQGFRARMKRDFQKDMMGFLNHLRHLQHWTLNSYNPNIDLEAMYANTEETPVFYAALPTHSEGMRMSLVGNILVNTFTVLSAYVQAAMDGWRRPILVVIDEAGAFVDENVVDWVCKVRSSGFRVVLAGQTMSDFDRIHPNFTQRLLGNTPNVFMFDPHERKAAEWFSGLAREKLVVQRSRHTDSEEATGKGIEKEAAEKRIHPDALLSQRNGQCHWLPAAQISQAIHLAAPSLPSAPVDPFFHWNGPDRTQNRGSRVGLHMGLRLNRMQRTPFTPWR